MMPASPPMDLIDQLRCLLDEETALLDLRRSQLVSLCESILERDDDAVERTLEQVERAQQLQAETDAKLNALRLRLADALHLDREEVRLSALIGLLDEPLRAPLAERRQRLIDLAEQLQLQHLRTVMLVTECARINRMLLEGLFPDSEGVATYGMRGAEPWQPDTGLVDAER